MESAKQTTIGRLASHQISFFLSFSHAIICHMIYDRDPEMFLDMRSLNINIAWLLITAVLHHCLRALMDKSVSPLASLAQFQHSLSKPRYKDRAVP